MNIHFGAYNSASNWRRVTPLPPFCCDAPVSAHAYCVSRLFLFHGSSAFNLQWTLVNKKEDVLRLSQTLSKTKNQCKKYPNKKKKLTTIVYI